MIYTLKMIYLNSKKLELNNLTKELLSKVINNIDVYSDGSINYTTNLDAEGDITVNYEEIPKCETKGQTL